MNLYMLDDLGLGLGDGGAVSTMEDCQPASYSLNSSWNLPFHL